MSRKRRFDILQEAAADCCIRIMMEAETAPHCALEALRRVYDEIHEAYGLCTNPFTHLPCSEYEYFQSLASYDRQCMEDRYG